MKIQQIQEFSLFDRRDSEQTLKVRIYRDTFAKSCDQFFMEKTTQKGELICREEVSERFAEIVLNHALVYLPKEDVLVTKLSTGTVFNYPIPHV
jgi:hypothetical protein